MKIQEIEESVQPLNERLQELDLSVQPLNESLQHLNKLETFIDDIEMLIREAPWETETQKLINKFRDMNMGDNSRSPLPGRSTAAHPRWARGTAHSTRPGSTLSV